MFFLAAVMFAAAPFQYSGELEDEDVGLADEAVFIEQDDEAQDGELVFSDEEVVAELDCDN